MTRTLRALVAIGALAIAPATPRAQSPAPVTATDTVDERAAARVADAVCGKQLVLLGELPEHGHARGFAIKARIVERLVRQCGFRAVLFEAGSYDFFGLERSIAAKGASPDSLELALARAIGGLWWTRELGDWRRWLVREAVAGRVVLGGIDDQPGVTSAWAKATLPAMVGAAVPPARATECREAVARYMRWGYGPAQRYDSTERARLAGCAAQAAGPAPSAREAERRTPDALMLDDIAGYFTRERTVATLGNRAPPDRDLVMARHVAWWAARLPRGAKIVVWTAASHATRAAGEGAVRPLDVPPLGARLAERWGDRLASVGFTALRGEWGWAGQAPKPLAALPAGSLEARALARGAAGDTAAWAWLDRAALRRLGAVPSRLFSGGATMDWSTAFDGVLVIRDERAPTFEPRR